MTDLEYIAEYKQKCKEVGKKFEYISSIVEKNKSCDDHIYLSDSIQKKLTAELKLLDDELILKLEKYYEDFIKPDEDEKEDEKNEENEENEEKEKNEKSFWEDFWEENEEDEEDEDK